MTQKDEMAFQRQEWTKSGEPRWPIYWRDLEGKQRKKQFSDPKESDRFLLVKQADEVRGTPEPSRTKFSVLWERWKKEASGGLTPKVRKMYLSLGERLLIRYFGKMALSDIQRQVIPKWIAWASERAEAGSVQKAFTVLSSVMGYALDIGLVQANPCSGMGKYLPKVKEPRIRPHLTPTQVLELAQAVDHTFRAMIMSMAVLGLRPGEAIALQYQDLDLEAGTLHVHRSATDAGPLMVVRETTKTGEVRTIPLMATEKAFRDHVRSRYDIEFWVPAMGTRRLPDPDALLFTSRFTKEDGLIHTAALAALVRRAGKRIGVEGLSADDLRHVANANVLEITKGDVTFASRLLGNSPEINLRHYDQGTATRWDRAIKAVNDAYGVGLS